MKDDPSQGIHRNMIFSVERFFVTKTFQKEFQYFSVPLWRPSQVFSYVALQRKKRGDLIHRIEVWLLLQFIRLAIFYREESSIRCTIQPSGVVFGGVLEPQPRKLFVSQEMGYNSKNIGAAVKTFQCRGRPNLAEGAYQKPCKQNWRSYGQKQITYFNEAFFQVTSLKQCY